MSASNYAENKLVDHLLGTAPFAKPNAVYLGLFTADPGEDGTGPEVSGNGYVRQLAAFSAAVAGTARNSAGIIFPTASGGAWGNITFWGIFDALTAGNLLVSGAFTTARSIGDGDALLVNAADLSVTQD